MHRDLVETLVDIWSFKRQEKQNFVQFRKKIKFM